MSATEAPVEGHELFDGSQYDLPIPTIDGHKADVLRIAIGGGLDLDLYDNASLAWLEQLKLGRELSLQVTVRVTGNAWRHTLKAEEDESVVHQVALKITGIDIPSTE